MIVAPAFPCMTLSAKLFPLDKLSWERHKTEECDQNMVFF